MSEMDKIFKLMEEVEEEAKPENNIPAEAPPPAEDPLAKFIGNDKPLVETSPFDAFLDQCEAEAPEEVKNAQKAYEDHDWKSVRQTMYGNDHDVWRCQRCFRQVNVERNETLGEALRKHNVHPDCSVQIAAEVMET